MSEPITLHVDARCISPYALSAYVALTEKRLPFTLAKVSLDDGAQHGAFASRTRRVPLLEHGSYRLAESSAIAEYLAETFPAPGHPRIFPADLRERGVCREVQAFVRSDLMAIREERSTATIWYAPATAPLSEAGQAARAKLIAYAAPLVEDRTTLFGDWCIADVDLGVMLLRLRHDDLPPELLRYADAQWGRASVVAWNALAR